MSGVLGWREALAGVGAGGGTGWGGGGGGDASLNVAAVEGVALEVPLNILHAWQLHPVLVHAPADAAFAATGRLALGARTGKGGEDGCACRRLHPRPALRLPAPRQTFTPRELRGAVPLPGEGLGK